MNPLTLQIDSFGIWHITLFWGLFAIGVGFIIKQPKWIPLPAKLLWGYTLFSALFTVEFPSFSYREYHALYMSTAGQTLIEVLFIPWAAIHYPKVIKKGLPYVVAFEIFAVFFAPQSRGLMTQGSFDQAFLALSLPFVHWSLGLLALGAIFTHHGSTALSVLAAFAGAYAWRKNKLFLLTIPALGILAYFHSHGPLLDGKERIETWLKFIQFWVTNPEQVLFGVGAGSFMWSSIILRDYKPPFFMYLHNDWLQLAFESGVVAVGLALAVVYKALQRSLSDPKISGAVLAACAFALTYSPLRFFPSALVVALIFREALVQDA